jgi:hypothetical protein
MHFYLCLYTVCKFRIEEISILLYNLLVKNSSLLRNYLEDENIFNLRKWKTGERHKELKTHTIII